jgi:hypothetical protein
MCLRLCARLCSPPQASSTPEANGTVGKQQQLFLGPAGGSMKLVSGAQLVQVIRSEAPLGMAMLGKCEGDEVSIQVTPIRQQFEGLQVQ